MEMKLVSLTTIAKFHPCTLSRHCQTTNTKLRRDGPRTWKWPLFYSSSDTSWSRQLRIYSRHERANHNELLCGQCNTNSRVNMIKPTNLTFLSLPSNLRTSRLAPDIRYDSTRRWMTECGHLSIHDCSIIRKFRTNPKSVQPQATITTILCSPYQRHQWTFRTSWPWPTDTTNSRERFQPLI